MYMLSLSKQVKFSHRMLCFAVCSWIFCFMLHLGVICSASSLWVLNCTSRCSVFHFATGPLDVCYSSSLDVVWFILLQVHQMCVTVHYWMLCVSSHYWSTGCLLQFITGCCVVHFTTGPPDVCYSSLLDVVCFIPLLVHWMSVTVHHWMLCGSFYYRSTRCVLQFITGCCVFHPTTGPLDVCYSSSLDVVWFISLQVHQMCVTVHHWMLCVSSHYWSTGCLLQFIIGCSVVHFTTGPPDVCYSSSLDVVWFISLQVYQMCVTVHHWMLCGSFRYRSPRCVLQFITGCCVLHFATGPPDACDSSSLDVVWFISLQVHQLCVTVHHWMLCGSRDAERTAAAAQDRPECPEKADRHGVS